MVLSKFFGKKSKPAKTTAKSPGNTRTETVKPGIDLWLVQARADDPKQRREAMVELARALDEGKLTAAGFIRYKPKVAKGPVQP